MSRPRPTTKFRLAAAAALGAASRAEPTFPADVSERPIVIAVVARPDCASPDDDLLEALDQAADAVREAVARQAALFRLEEPPGTADVEVTLTRASRQPSLDFWETMHAHARLVVRATGEVLDTGSDYIEGRDWSSVASTLLFLVKLHCAEHYEAIVRGRRAAPAPPAPGPDRETATLDVDKSMLSDDHLRGLLARLRDRGGPRRR